MNPGSLYPHDLELQATKAAASQARSLRGFFVSRAMAQALAGHSSSRHGADYGGLKATGMPHDLILEYE